MERQFTRKNLINFSEILERGEQERSREESRVVETHRSVSHPRGNTSVLRGLEGRKKSGQAKVEKAPLQQPSRKMRIKTDFTELSNRNKRP